MSTIHNSEGAKPQRNAKRVVPAAALLICIAISPVVGVAAFAHTDSAPALSARPDTTNIVNVPVPPLPRVFNPGVNLKLPLRPSVKLNPQPEPPSRIWNMPGL